MHCSSAGASFLVKIQQLRCIHKISRCTVHQQVLLAEPLGSLAFKMVQIRQLVEEQQVKLETSRWVALCLSKGYVFRVLVVSF
ncbi:hypothetical protein F511_11711 [Dorcoceras hygrometricum]|uniref:Uncharacterized protein n=1 Tax=Dorcoceras hygrometricum TaxID=472368 RepID=A0A2Z7A787_9LAMI|nr:hypothetical protein F511_11711 [Dorcoceras hygrometricum]